MEMSGTRSLFHAAWIVVLVSSLAGCAGYQSALGFRARRAALDGNAQAFDDLMEEAADAKPLGPLDKPKLTVLTHFLDLADSPFFFPMIEKWKKRGWVGEDMTCAIHRARYRKMVGQDADEADRAAYVCVDRAREAAAAAREWELEACLEEAPFLVDTSTQALVPFLEIASNPAEPVRFRHGLIDGMTRVYITSANRMEGNDPSLTREQAVKIASDKIEKQSRRIDWIIEAIRPHMKAPLLASATARGVLEVENVAVPLGFSYVGRFALSEDPYDNDLAWGWVRAIKNRKMITRIKGLGLWNRSIEPKLDVYWYLCVRPDAVTQDTVLGKLRITEAISVRRRERAVDPATVIAEHCPPVPGRPAFSEIVGPFPLETTARATLESKRKVPTNKSRTSVRVVSRVLE